MGSANFIKNRFIDQELCIYLGEEAETLTYSESWAANKEYFRGFVKEVEDNIIVFEIPDNGTLYINGDAISLFWQPDFEYYQAVFTSITRRPTAVNKRATRK